MLTEATQRKAVLAMAVRKVVTSTGDRFWIHEALPGLTLEYYEISLTPEADTAPYEEAWSFRVDFCLEGRLDGVFTRRRFDSLSAGEFAVNNAAFRMLKHVFPLRFYRGLSLIVDDAKLPDPERGMLRRMGIAFDDLLARWDTEDRWFKRQAEGPVLQIMKDLWQFRDEAEPSYISVKFLELMYWLNRMEEDRSEGLEYLAGDRVDAVRLAVMRTLEKGARMEDLDDEMARLSLTPSTFYRIFRAVYQESPARFFRHYRLDRAALRLRRTDDPVEAIAWEAGYRSPSKFAAAFKRHIGRTPTAYREQALHFFDEPS